MRGSRSSVCTYRPLCPDSTIAKTRRYLGKQRIEDCRRNYNDIFPINSINHPRHPIKDVINNIIHRRRWSETGANPGNPPNHHRKQNYTSDK
jgi:hypothetical protein